MFSYGYPRSYNPYSYGQSPFYGRQPSSSTPYEEAILRERARALAEQRARRAQWLPDEVAADNSDEDMEYSQLRPRERAYLDALKRQQMIERLRKEAEEEEFARREEAARQKAAEEQKWLQGLEKRQREDEQQRQRLLEQRKREIQLRREEAEKKLRAEYQQRRQEVGQSSARGSETNTVPINFRNANSSRSPNSRSPSTPSTPGKETTPSPRQVYTEAHEDAASKIQNRYRVHSSHKTLDALASQFQTLKSEFAYPRVIDFQQPGSGEGPITVRVNRSQPDFNDLLEAEAAETPMDVDGSEPKLAYTSLNYPLHMYTDAMDKLLMKLDGVESWGEKSVRMKRRSIVREISEESSRLERYWKQVWADHLAETREQEDVAEEQVETQEDITGPEDVQTQHDLELEDEPVHVGLPETRPEDDEWLHVDESISRDESKEKEENEEAEVMQNLRPKIEVEEEQPSSVEVDPTT